MIIQEKFPGLKECINRWVVPTQGAMVSSVNDCLSGQVATKVSGKLSGYMAVKQFLDPNVPLFRIRMDSDLSHILAVEEKPKEHGNLPQGRCAFCCEKCCEKGESTAVIKKCLSRIGQKQ